MDLAVLIPSAFAWLPAAQEPVEFGLAPPLVGSHWRFERTTETSVRMKVTAEGVLVLDNDESQVIQEILEVVKVPPFAGTMPRYEMRDEEGEAIYQVGMLEDDLWYIPRDYWKPPPEERPVPVLPPGPRWFLVREPRLTEQLAPAGVFPPHRVSAQLAGSSFRPGDPWTIDVEAMEMLVRPAFDMKLSGVTATLREVREGSGRIAVFDVVLELTGGVEEGVTSATVARLEGTFELEVASSWPRRMDVKGNFTVRGEGEPDGIATSLEGQGSARLTLRWDPAPER